MNIALVCVVAGGHAVMTHGKRQMHIRPHKRSQKNVSGNQRQYKTVRKYPAVLELMISETVPAFPALSIP